MTKPELVHIVAMDQNRCIGIGDQLPWRIPSDLQYFKSMTDGHYVLFGNKTYDTLPPIKWGTRIPFRLSRQGGKFATKIEDLWNIGPEVLGAVVPPCTDKIFICGGSEIYAASLDHVNTLYITEVLIEVQGDKFYPEFRDQFNMVYASQYFNENNLKFRFTKWVRA